jgi:hypothetical protein
MKSATSQTLINRLDITESEVLFYKNEGYLCLPGLIASDAVALLREEVLDILDANGVTRSMLSNASSPADKLRQCSQYLANGCLMN